MKMWSGRFREPLDAGFERWQRSFPFDWRLLPQELAASQAHAAMLRGAGILDQAEFDAITAGLQHVAKTAEEAKVLWWKAGQEGSLASPQHLGAALVFANPQAEDIHHYVELQLTTALGTLALKLHTGRSRNEQIATDLRLFVREMIDAAVSLLNSWIRALLGQADHAKAAVMPSYTHLQRAEPVLVAHWFLAYVNMAERDLSRLQDCRARLNFCPLGSGAVAGATLKLDRSIAASALNFEAPTRNSMDATSDRDFAVEFSQVAAQIGLHLSRFAEELTLYSTAEFGFLDLPERFSTGSSAMPQKKNPDLTELVRGKSGRLLGGATTLAVIVKGLPLAYNKDMQETQEATFEVADTLIGMLEVMAPFTEALRFRYERMELAAGEGYLNAMAAATYLVHKGVPFRIAHEKIGNAVRYALERGVELNGLSLEELRSFGEEFGPDFHDAITLRATLDCHDVVGGTATERVREALAEAWARFGVGDEVDGN